VSLPGDIVMSLPPRLYPPPPHHFSFMLFIPVLFFYPRPRQTFLPRIFPLLTFPVRSFFSFFLFSSHLHLDLPRITLHSPLFLSFCSSPYDRCSRRYFSTRPLLSQTFFMKGAGFPLLNKIIFPSRVPSAPLLFPYLCRLASPAARTRSLIQTLIFFHCPRF